MRKQFTKKASYKIDVQNYRKSIALGFTLIEILVSFSVAVILSGIGIVSLVSYGRSQQMSQTASNIKLLINEAKFNALSGVKTETDDSGNIISCGNDSLDGFMVSVVGNKSLDLSMVCDGNITQIRRLSLPDQIEFGVATSCVTIIFSSIASSASGLPCEIGISGYSQSRNINIDTIGNVTVN